VSAVTSAIIIIASAVAVTISVANVLGMAAIYCAWIRCTAVTVAILIAVIVTIVVAASHQCKHCRRQHKDYEYFHKIFHYRILLSNLILFLICYFNA